MTLLVIIVLLEALLTAIAMGYTILTAAELSRRIARLERRLNLRRRETK